MKVYPLIIVLIFSCLLLSCKNDDDSAKPNEYAAKILAKLNPTDTFLFDLPSTNNFIDSVYLAHLPLQEKWLNLQSLQKGFDSIEIRVWYGCYIGCGHRLVRLVHNRKKWQAEISNLIHYGGGKEGSGPWMDSMSRNIEYKTPKSGWLRFIDSLFDLKILTLSNDYEIPNFKQNEATDGSWINIEISTKRTYRFYEYEDPQWVSYDAWQVKNMLRIIKLLSTEFNISEWPEIKLRDPEKEIKKNTTEKITIRELKLVDDTVKKKRMSNK